MTAQNDTAGPAFGFPTALHPEEGEKVRPTAKTQPDEDQLDEAISQSFPASDPVSVTVSPVPKDEAEKEKEAGPQAGVTARPALWAAALVSTTVLGLGAALLWGRHRRAQQPAVKLADGLRGAWAQAGRQVGKAGKQGQQAQRGLQRLLHSLHR